MKEYSEKIGKQLRRETVGLHKVNVTNLVVSALEMLVGNFVYRIHLNNFCTVSEVVHITSEDA